MSLALRRLLPGVLVLLAACVDDYRSAGSAQDDLDDNGVNNAPNQEPGDNGMPSSCTTDSDCPGEQYCYGPTACGSAWACQDEYPGCSAAAPFVACSCGGAFISAAAGCPPRHAWSATFLFGDYIGSPCDPATPLTPEDIAPLDLIYEGRELGGYENNLVRVRILALQSPPPGVEEETATIRDGAFDFAWPGLGERLNNTSFNALTLVDFDGDGVCDPDEPILIARIPNPHDLTIDEARLTLTPENLGEFTSSCEWWNTP